MDKKTKKTTINPINKKDKYFQYAVKVALNYEEIKKDLQKITKIKPFINKYNWDGINFPSEDYWKKIEEILLMFQNITQIVKNKLFF